MEKVKARLTFDEYNSGEPFYWRIWRDQLPWRAEEVEAAQVEDAEPIGKLLIDSMSIVVVADLAQLLREG